MVFLEATGQVFRGDAGEGELFKSSKRGDLSYVGHLRGYHDITESTNLDLGASVLARPQRGRVVDDVDVGRFTTRAVRRRRDVAVASADAAPSITSSSARPR